MATDVVQDSVPDGAEEEDTTAGEQEATHLPITPLHKEHPRDTRKWLKRTASRS